MICLRGWLLDGGTIPSPSAWPLSIFCRAEIQKDWLQCLRDCLEWAACVKGSLQGKLARQPSTQAVPCSLGRNHYPNC